MTTDGNFEGQPDDINEFGNLSEEEINTITEARNRKTVAIQLGIPTKVIEDIISTEKDNSDFKEMSKNPNMTSAYWDLAGRLYNSGKNVKEIIKEARSNSIFNLESIKDEKPIDGDVADSDVADSDVADGDTTDSATDDNTKASVQSSLEVNGGEFSSDFLKGNIGDGNTKGRGVLRTSPLDSIYGKSLHKYTEKDCLSIVNDIGSVIKAQGDAISDNFITTGNAGENYYQSCNSMIEDIIGTSDNNAITELCVSLMSNIQEGVNYHNSNNEDKIPFTQDGIANIFLDKYLGGEIASLNQSVSNLRKRLLRR